MLVFSEGVPGSGKSYDAVKNHILPALKKGRTVFARVNGLDHDKIAAYLGADPADVRARLIHVPTDQVVTLFVASQDQAGEWSIAENLRNALVVIDEVHDFYVGGTREVMPKDREQFFALHRHFGLDILILTQFYKRVHVALRSRIERKNTFQKLSVLGKQGESAYRETFYQTIAPDRYEKIGGANHKYEAAIFPLYQGITSAEVQTEVYGSGRLTVWKSMMWRAAFIVPVGLFAAWFLLDFFSGGGSALVKEGNGTSGPSKVQAVADPYARRASAQANLPTAQEEARAAANARKAKLASLSPEQRYVWELSEKSRIRLAATIGDGDQARGLVEWVNGSQVVQERLSLRQLRDLGIVVTVHKYGVRLQARDEALIATAWPLTAPLREVQPRLYNTSGASGNAASVSELNSRSADTGSFAGVVSYSGHLPGRGQTGPGLTTP